MKSDDLIRVEQLTRALKNVPPTSFDAVELLDHRRGCFARLGDDRAYTDAREVLKVAGMLRKRNVNSYVQSELVGIIERAYMTLAPVDFHSYLMALEWNRAEKDKFYQNRQEILRPVADVLTDMEVRNKYDYLLLSMPPGSGKSTIGLFFLSWVIGRHPEKLNLASGYAHKITKSFYEGLNSIYDDPDYQYHQIFPKLNRVMQSADDLVIDFRNDERKVSRRFKSFTARSIDGSLTGATRCDNYLYVDDLVADIEEALNPVRLNSLWLKYMSNLRTRKKLGCKEIHIGTRWSIHDPLGRLESELVESDDPSRIKVIRIPALDDNDESNFDYRHGVGFNTQMFREMRASYEKSDDLASWHSLYQQEPIEREGLQFPKDKLNYYHQLPADEPDDRFAWVDVAFGGGDHLSMPVAYQYGEDVYIVDVVYDKGDYEVTQPRVENCLVRNQVQRVCFESNAGGDFYARDVDERIKKSKVHINVTTKRAKSNMSKAARIDQHQPAIKNFYFLDSSKWNDNPEYGKFMRDLTSYTVTGKNKNDDAPDSLSGLASMMRVNLNATISVMRRPV